MSDALPFLTAPLPDLAAWTEHFRTAPVPVLAATAAEIEQLRQLEDSRGCVDAQMLYQAVGLDPLMTICVLRHAGQHRSRHQVTDAETITAAVMLMGIGPFFHAFAALPTVEARLAGQPGAFDGLKRVLARSQRAGHIALAFANHRMDSDAAAVHLAASLHDFAEMLLWCHAPALATRLAECQAADPQRRSADAQQALLHTTLPQLEQALMRAWRLPELLVQLTDDGQPHALVAPQRRTVQLAVRLARHSAAGWHDAALPDDLHDIADFLNLSISATQRLLKEI